MAIKIMNDKILLREIVIVLLVKLVLLFIIWHSFFDDDVPPVTANAISDKFISDTTEGDAL